MIREKTLELIKRPKHTLALRIFVKKQILLSQKKIAKKMSETESEAQEEQSRCKSNCNPIGVCLHNVRGTIAKVWVWGGMIALSVSFALLYTYCRGSLTR